MNTRRKIYLISFIILIICLLTAGIIYIYTGNLVIAIFVAPPIIHWILQHRNKLEE